MSSKHKRHQRSHLTVESGIEPVKPLRDFQAFLLEANPLLSPSSLALGCLIGFDLVVQPKDIPNAFAALQKIHTYQDRPFIRWAVPPPADDRADSVLNRGGPETLMYDERAVSSFTVIAVSEVVVWRSPNDCIEELFLAMQRHPRRAHLPPSWNALLASAQAYAVVHLPNALRAHVIGQFRMCALDPGTTARETSRLALSAQVLDLEVEEELAIGETKLARSISLHQLPSAAIQGDLAWVHDRAADLVDDIVKATHAGKGQGSARAAVMRELKNVQVRLGDLHPWPRLLHMVALILVQEHQLAPASIGRYFSGGGKRLFLALQDINPAKIDPEQLIKRIEEVHASAEDSNKPSVSALSQALLALLIRTELMDPVKLPRLQKQITSVNVRAQVVFPHEVDRALDWLDEAVALNPGDPILPMTRLLIGFCRDFGLRPSEALRLRLNNLQLMDEQLHVAVDPTRADPSLKTAESRRLVSSTAPRTVQNLLGYLEARYRAPVSGPAGASHLSESSTDDLTWELKSWMSEQTDLLFGDPSKPNQIWHEAHVRKWASILMKSCTGDQRSTLYDLRHSWVTFGNARDFCRASPETDSVFDLRANALGHAANDLMFTSYTHQFGEGIRWNVDQQIVQDRLLRSQSAAAWIARTNSSVTSSLKKHDANLRQRLSRAGAKSTTDAGQQHMLGFIKAHAHGMDLPSAANAFGIPLQAPESPLTNYRPRGLAAQTLLQCLLQLGGIENQGNQRRRELAIAAGMDPSKWSLVLDEFRWTSSSTKGVRSPSILEPDPHAWLVREYWAPVISSALSQKWERLMSYLDSQPFDRDVDLAKEYVLFAMGCSGYLPVLVGDERFQALVRVIRASGMNLSSLYLHYLDDTPDNIRDARHALSKMRQLLGLDIQLRTAAARSGRPSLYLTIRSHFAQHLKDPNHDGSAHSMKGFAGLFLGVHLKRSHLEATRHAA